MRTGTSSKEIVKKNFYKLGILTLLSVVLSVSTYYIQQESRNQTYYRIDDVLRTRQFLLQALKAAEASQKSFLLTNDYELLDPYLDFPSLLRNTIDRLYYLSDDSYSLGKLKQLKEFSDEKLTILSEGVDATVSKDDKAGEEKDRIRREKDLTVKIEDLLRELKVNDLNELRIKDREFNIYKIFCLILFLVALLFNYLSILFLYSS